MPLVTVKFTFVASLESWEMQLPAEGHTGKVVAHCIDVQVLERQVFHIGEWDSEIMHSDSPFSFGSGVKQGALQVND
jgi:hypothetical protein